MQYGSFRGRDVAEAIHAVKAAYGADALIGETRHVAGESMPGAVESYVEVDAAPSPSTSQAGGRRTPFSLDIERPYAKAPDDAAKPIPFRPRKISIPELADLPTSHVSNELIELRALVEQLSASQPSKSRAMAILYESGIEGGLATRIAAAISRGTKDASDEDLREALREQLRADLSVMPSPIAARGRLAIACVGPTGVGKTTTIAKLAARAALDLGRTVSVITTDTYRIGAVDQVERFSELIGISCYVAPDPESFSRVISSCPSDIVFVDTGGGNQPSVLSRILGIMGNQTGRRREVLLALPASIRGRDAERVALTYTKSPVSGIVITKTDEAQVAGGVVHAITRGGYPVAYVCNGPRVPEDIEDAEIDKVVSLLVHEST